MTREEALIFLRLLDQSSRTDIETVCDMWATAFALREETASTDLTREKYTQLRARLRSARRVLLGSAHSTHNRIDVGGPPGRTVSSVRAASFDPARRAAAYLSSREPSSVRVHPLPLPPVISATRSSSLSESRLYEDKKEYELQSAPGALIAGRFVIERRVAGCGVGEVFVARDQHRDENVALELLLPVLGRYPAARHRFLDEGKAVRDQPHPNVATVFDAGEANGLAYLARELALGVNLREEMRRRQQANRPFSIRTSVIIAARLCGAMSFSRAHGLTRRLSAQFIWASERVGVKLLDFGVSRLMHADALRRNACTNPGQVLESPQIVDPSTAGQTDCRAIGALLYELLTGARPVGSFRSPRDLRENIPAEISDVVMRALLRHTDLPFGNTAQMKAALAVKPQIKRPVATPPKPQKSTEPLRLRRWIHRLWIPAAAAAIVVGLGGVAQWAGRTSAGRSPTELRVERLSDGLMHASDETEALAATPALVMADHPDPADANPSSNETRAGQRDTATGASQSPLVPSERVADAGGDRPVDAVDASTPSARKSRTAAPSSGGSNTVGAPTEAGVETVESAERTSHTNPPESSDAEQTSPPAQNPDTHPDDATGKPDSPPAGMGSAPQDEPEAEAASELRIVSQAPTENPNPSPPRPRSARVSRTGPRAFFPMTAEQAVKVRAEAAELHNVEPALTLALPDNVVLELSLIPDGEFILGSLQSEPGRYGDESPQHLVQIERPFYMSAFEVTQEQWLVVMESNPSGEPELGRPVDSISWHDAQEFCHRLSQMLSRTVRLPFEAEWEYACRAGRMTPFNFGASIDTGRVNYDGRYTYGRGRSGLVRGRPVAAGSFAPNPWGLYDMHGNVWEWCQDAYVSYSALVDGVEELADDDLRVVRGGSWRYSPSYCRSAGRARTPRDNRSDDCGLRVVVEIP